MRTVKFRPLNLPLPPALSLTHAPLAMTLSRVTDVRFAQSGDVHVAYRFVGEGPLDLVYAQGAFTHLEIYWELPAFRRYCERLAEFTRLILFDKRGMGMSDRVPGATTLEERMDDVRAVMDAVGSERAAVMGESEGGPLAMLFAAAHPERTVALILQGAEVRERTDEEWPWGEDTEEEFESAMAGEFLQDSARDFIALLGRLIRIGCRSQRD